MRLGSYKASLKPGSIAAEVYGETEITERHRHRYEVNEHYLARIRQAGLRVSGLSTKDGLCEMIELPNHPWFVACQFHPEFTSTPRDGHPLFKAFVQAAIANHGKAQSSGDDVPMKNVA